MRNKEQAHFYKTQKWKDTRDGYMSSVGGLCEICREKGLYNPAVIIHHIEHVTPENVYNPEITLNWNNLQALCRKCHADQHEEMYKKEKNRYKFVGDKIFFSDPPQFEKK